MRIGVISSIGETLDAFFPPLIAEWESAGADVSTAAGTPTRSRETRLIHRLSRRPRVDSLLARRDIQLWVEEQGLDVVVTNTAVASFLTRIAPVGAPVVYFCHGLHWDSSGGRATPSIWKVAERLCLSNTAGVITMNSDDRAWFAERCGDRPQLHLRFGVGVPTERFPFVPPPPPRPLRLLWAGELEERKRPQLAVEVMAELRRRQAEVTLAMIGSGGLIDEVRHMVDVQGLGNHVQVRGRQDMAESLAASHALLHTARWEGLPRVGLEAYVAGRPVVAFDTKGTRDLPNAITVDDGDLHALATAIESLGRSGIPRPLTVDPGVGVPAVAATIHRFLASVVPPTRGDVRVAEGAGAPRAGVPSTRVKRQLHARATKRPSAGEKNPS